MSNSPSSDHSEPDTNPANERSTSEDSSIVSSAGSSSWKDLYQTEDWWAVWLGGLILVVSFLAIYSARPADISDKLTTLEEKQAELHTLISTPGTEAKVIKAKRDEIKSFRGKVAPNPIKPWVSKIQKWSDSPQQAYFKNGKTPEDEPTNLVSAVLVVGLVSLVLFAIGCHFIDQSCKEFMLGFPLIFLLANISYILASQTSIKEAGIGYPLWALLVGLLISNTIGTPKFLKPAVKTEFFIKTGLVLLGAKILLDRLLVLGVPGIFVAWVVTPIVLVTTYWFGQKILKISSRTLNMTISADMSVCGVSAAIATASACRAKKEELSMAVGLSLAFTAIMMFVLPLVIKALGLSEVLGGAWMGGTIDATGAVAAAGATLGSTAEEVAITVKMIQNILIGVIAFFVAIYWVIYVEPQKEGGTGSRLSLWEIWYRFPKFVIGFVTASLIFSYLSVNVTGGDAMITNMYKQTTDVFRGWFFCLAFVCIGLETNFRKLASLIEGGKPLVLYLCGQTLNLLLTLFMAWLMFEVIFKESIDNMLK